MSLHAVIGEALLDNLSHVQGLRAAQLSSLRDMLKDSSNAGGESAGIFGLCCTRVISQKDPVTVEKENCNSTMLDVTMAAATPERPRVPAPTAAAVVAVRSAPPPSSDMWSTAVAGLLHDNWKDRAAALERVLELGDALR